MKIIYTFSFKDKDGYLHTGKHTCSDKSELKHYIKNCFGAPLFKSERKDLRTLSIASAYRRLPNGKLMDWKE